jgi:hypothetical protein
MSGIYLMVSLAFVSTIILVIPVPVLSQLSERNLETHIHVHLKMIKDGHDIIVPANIGIDHRLWKNHTLDRYSANPAYVSALHTHTSDGEIHIESTTFRKFTFGDFLNVWGIDQTKIEDVRSDGKQFNLSDYRSIPLHDHQSLEVTIKTEGSPKNITHFADPASGLAFEYPSNWTLTNSSFRSYQSAVGERFLSTLQLSPNEGDFLNATFLIPHLRIDVNKLPPNNVTLDQYIIANLPMILQSKIQYSPNFIEFPKAIKSDLYNFNGNSARNITLVNATITEAQQLNNTTETQSMQIWTIKNDKAYIISYSGITSPYTTSYTYSGYLPTVEKILKSIKID